MPISDESNGDIIKLTVFQRIHEGSNYSYAELSDIFDKHDIWNWFDEDYEFMHCEGVEANADTIKEILRSDGVQI
jgi:hypothetical protein